MLAEDIQNRIIQAIVSRTDKITYFGVGGVARAFVEAVSMAVEKMYYEMDRIERSLFFSTAVGSELDRLGGDVDMERAGAAVSGVDLLFQGTPAILVPQGTQVRSSSGIIFETTKAITLGRNPIMNGLSGSLSLGDSVGAVSTTTGEDANVPAFTVTELVNPIAGVSSVTNPAPAQGGADTESDGVYRYRLIRRISSLEKGTQAFYEAAAQEATESWTKRAIRAIAAHGDAYRTVDVKLAANTGSGFTSGELDQIASYIQDLAPIDTVIVCSNITFTGINVYAEIKLSQGYTLQEVYRDVADALANYIDFSTWQWGEDVRNEELLSIVTGIDGIRDVATSTFEPDGDVEVSDQSLPKLTSLYLKDLDTGSTYGSLLSQAYP